MHMVAHARDCLSLRSLWEVGMSTQGWREFLDAEDVEDWVVLHGGATAVFRVGSLDEAVELARAVAQVPGLERSGVVLTIADHQVAVRLTRHFSQLERQHLDLARAITAVTQALGAVPDRAAAQQVSARDRCEARLGRWGVLARRARVHGRDRRQRGRPAGPRVVGLDAGARRGQAVAARHACRRLGRARARRGASRGGARRGRPHRGRLRSPGAVDARRRRGQPGVHLRLARRGHHARIALVDWTVRPRRTRSPGCSGA